MIVAISRRIVICRHLQPFYPRPPPRPPPPPPPPPPRQCHWMISIYLIRIVM